MELSALSLTLQDSCFCLQLGGRGNGSRLLIVCYCEGVRVAREWEEENLCLRDATPEAILCSNPSTTPTQQRNPKLLTHREGVRLWPKNLLTTFMFSTCETFQLGGVAKLVCFGFLCSAFFVLLRWYGETESQCRGIPCWNGEPDALLGLAHDYFR